MDAGAPNMDNNAQNSVEINLSKLNAVLAGKMRRIKTIHDLGLSKNQNLRIHGLESIVQGAFLTVGEFKNLVGAGAVYNTDWYVTDQCLDYYASILICHKSEEKPICFLSAQYGIG